MSTVRISPKGRKATTRPNTVTLKTVVAADGSKTRVLAIDANSPSFGDDFLYVFKQNVRRAREENKALFGSPNGVKPD